jgi:hypothetical protein
MSEILILICANCCRWQLFFAAVREALETGSALDELQFRAALLAQARLSSCFPVSEIAGDSGIFWEIKGDRADGSWMQRAGLRLCFSWVGHIRGRSLDTRMD